MPMNDHSQEPERTTTRKVYCMYEGLVEKQYFDHFNGKCDINFSEIPRSGLDSDKFNENIAEYEDSFASADVYKTDGWNYTSKRWDMIQIADNYISCIQNEKYTTFGFISEVLSEIWLNMKRENRKPYVKFLFKFYSLLNSGNISIEQFMKTETIKTAADYFSQVRKFITSQLVAKKEFYDKDGFIKAGDEKTVADIKTFVNELPEIKNFLHIIGRREIGFKPVYVRKGGTQKYDPTVDRTFVVIDRDYDVKFEKRIKEINDLEYCTPITETRSKREYKEYVATCNQKHIDLLISSPLFSIWLLMHHEGSLNSEIMKCFDLKDKKRIHKTLNQIEGRVGDEELKRITDERLETYFENQKHAIEVSEKMNLNESDFVEVSKPQGAKVGSNVGIKIKSLNIKYVTKNSKTERMQTEGNIC